MFDIFLIINIMNSSSRFSENHNIFPELGTHGARGNVFINCNLRDMVEIILQSEEQKCLKD